MKKTLIPFCILHSAFCICLADAVPVRFRADAASPQAFQAAAYRGETLALEAALTLRGAPLAVADGASATMCWQTNGMGSAWWTAPASVTTAGVVRATWTPSMDCGADAYRIFLGVADGGSNLNYRANMLLRMIGSPGETPNALPLPVQVLDFSKISWTNEPWSASSGLTTNDVEAIALTRAEAEKGFTEWVCEPAEYAGKPIVVDRFVEDGIGYWGVFYAAETNRCFGTSIEYPLAGEDYVTRISWPEILSTRTRLRPTPEQEATWDAKASSTNLPALPASATVGDLVDRINAIIGALHE